jgi:hypothetical protein
MAAGADPISAVGNVISSVFDFFTQKNRAKYERLPDWISPADFQNKSRSSDILLIGMFVVIIIIIIAVVLINRAK